LISTFGKSQATIFEVFLLVFNFPLENPHLLTVVSRGTGNQAVRFQFPPFIEHFFFASPILMRERTFTACLVCSVKFLINHMITFNANYCYLCLNSSHFLYSNSVCLFRIITWIQHVPSFLEDMQ